MKKNVTIPGGLHTDNSPIDQPENTTVFNLNVVNENDEGNSNRLSNENSNEECYQLTSGYVYLGDVYIGNNELLIFSVAEDESSSELGIVDRECNYTPLVNHDFGFRLSHQIDATYRLRRGCERTIYWTDPKPRIVNIDGLDDYKDDLGNYRTDSFNLFKTYSDIPLFSSIEIGEDGAIYPGSINFAVQYLDEDFNPTEFITSSDVIKIYNDNLSRDFSEIRGSTNRKSDYQDFGVTNKSVKITLSNLDTSYPFYRIAIIKADGGTGLITGVEYSHEIPIELPTYRYTGQGVTVGTVEEVQEMRLLIDSAEHIQQLEGKLILSNTKGKQVNYCNLQKYASRIKSNLVFKQVILNEISESNPKSPTASIDGTGYMPGEIYSFGIVYVFDDGSTTPVYHIPGKATTYPSQMSGNNIVDAVAYTDNASCEDYWGVDSEGNLLKNQPVRHHRFPLRSEVGKPLFEKSLQASKETTVSKLVVNIKYTGIVNDYEFPERVEVDIEYKIGEETKNNVSLVDLIDGAGVGMDISLFDDSGETPELLNIYENGTLVQNDGLFNYTSSIQSSVVTKEVMQYTAEIFGLDFSNVAKPSLSDTGGNEIVGYYIVRNERGEENKTILDSGVVMPLMEQEYFVAYGHSVPNGVTNIKKDAFALVHPEHKFLNREYKNTIEIIQEGEYVMSGSQSKSAVRTEDVMAGSSYDPEVAKRKENDGDGFTLHTFTRDTEFTYRSKKKDFIPADELDEVFYLNGLNSKAITDTDDVRKEIFNVSADNKIGIITSTVKRDYTSGIMPYVVLKRNLAAPYANFRYMPYYKQSKNITQFAEGPSTTTVFGGDAYIGSMRYFNSFYYDIRLRRRKTKSGLFNIIIGGLAIIAGALITGLTFGGATALGIAVAGFGLSQIATGINKEQIAKVYKELYEQGLRDCIKDDDTDATFNVNPPDDEIQWVGEGITNLWFESSVNIGLRQGLTMNLPDFLASPATKASNETWGANQASESAANELDNYLLEKLTTLDADAANGRLYQGFANAEFYELNLDYLRENHEKIYNHLGIEYDCCSDCNEVFPHRTHHSETSFQEELTDNYRIFLPNNYRDIEGEKGSITNLYKIQSNLYIHTEEALWHLPQNFQERVTGDILSFLGTGEFFNIPPKKIVDAEQSSAGTKHKWGTLKTKHGILFPSIDDLKWYLFTGNNLQPISDEGNFSWFKKNMPFKLEEQYYKSNKKSYPYNNNPASKFGIGFLCAYDSDKERFIITKKDYSLNSLMIQNSDYEICEGNGQLTLFNNYSQIIQGYQNDGFSYVGMDKCRMKFTKTIYDTVSETRQIKSTIPNTADLHFFLDTSGSFDKFISGSGLIVEGTDLGPSLSQIEDAADNWLAQFQAANPDWVGQLYKYYDSSERWLAYAKIIASTTYKDQNLAGKDIVVVSFCNEAQTVYNGGLQATIPTPTSAYINDYNSFKTIHSQYNSFIGIHYPIVFESGVYASQGKGLVQQSLAAIKGVPYTAAEASAIEYNEAFTTAEWKILTDSLQGANPYPDDGLENYGWIGKWNRNNIDGIIDAATFAGDIDGLLSATVTTTEITVEVKTPRTVENYVLGEVMDEGDFLQSNNSWTMSYSLKRKQWVSWHSYFPNFYLQLPNNFYAGLYGDGKIWRFNRKGHYQTFFGVYYPHIIEYVASANGMETVVTDSLMLQTEAFEYEALSENYVDKRFVTFNKLLVHNSRQLSGVLVMVVKDTNAEMEDYFNQQVTNNVGEIIIDKNEQDWYINGFRDMRVDYSKPMFRKDLISLQPEYFTDKVVNEGVVDVNKDWSQMESFRDKYLVVRLIFDSFDNIKLITNFSLEDETPSER